MKILFMSDSPVLYTGFGKVLKKIALYTARNTDWDVKVIGWYNLPNNEKNFFPFDIISTDSTDRSDIYGEKTFNRVVGEFKPDIVFVMGDEWMVRHVTESPYRNTFHLVMYSPIDGGPILPEWVDTFKKADTFVAYGNFGKTVIESRDSTIKVSTIPHGVDVDVFRKIEEPRGIPIVADDAFLIGMVGRNQPRKQLPRLIKMLSLFVSPWIKCLNCDATMVAHEEYKECMNCHSENIKFYPKKTNAFAYLHCSVNDRPGWNIKELVNRYGLSKNVIYPKNNEVGMGVPDSVLADFYNSFDVFTLPTQGEGFGLPILESMACGTPVVVTGYSGHTDFCNGVSDLIKVSEFVTEPRTNIERAIVDIDDYAMRMDRYYYEKDVFMEKWGNYIKANYGVDELECGKEYKTKMGELALNRAQSYDWKKILPVWVNLFKSIAGVKDMLKPVKHKIKEV